MDRGLHSYLEVLHNVQSGMPIVLSVEVYYDGTERFPTMD